MKGLCSATLRVSLRIVCLSFSIILFCTVGTHAEDSGATARAGGSTTQDLAHNNLAQDPLGTNSHPSPAQVNNDAAARSIASGQARPLSLTKGDFDHDGVEDLIVGYANPHWGCSFLASR